MAVYFAGLRWHDGMPRLEQAPLLSASRQRAVRRGGFSQAAELFRYTFMMITGIRGDAARAVDTHVA